MFTSLPRAVVGPRMILSTLVNDHAILGLLRYKLGYWTQCEMTCPGAVWISEEQGFDELHVSSY